MSNFSYKRMMIPQVHAAHGENLAAVLFVDDEVALLDVVETALNDVGHRCFCAATAEDALKILEVEPDIDVVVSDIRMPVMDGFALLGEIRERFGERRWLQMLVMTGHGSLENAVAALRLEAVDFLSKPVRRKELLEAVDRAAARALVQRQSLDHLQRTRDHLDRLVVETINTAEMFASLTGHQRPDMRTRPTANVAEDHNVSKSDRLLELSRMRRLRPSFFPDKVFSNPSWNMLLDLMEHQLTGRRLSVSSLCLGSGAAISTASRRLAELEAAGYVRRFDDPEDGRRQFVQLTSSAFDMVTAYLLALKQEISSKLRQ